MAHSGPTLNLMLGRDSFRSHFEPSLSPLGVVLVLLVAAFIFAGMFLLGIGRYWLGVVLLFPLVVAASWMAYRERRGSGRVRGLLNAAMVIGALIYVGLNLYGLSEV